jgi:hypothetical protein
MHNYNSYEQFVFRMTALIYAYFVIYYVNIIVRRVAIIAKIDY